MPALVGQPPDPGTQPPGLDSRGSRTTCHAPLTPRNATHAIDGLPGRLREIKNIRTKCGFLLHLFTFLALLTRTAAMLETRPLMSGTVLPIRPIGRNCPYLPPWVASLS